MHYKIHSGVKNYGCDICSKCFISASKLRLHIAIHTGEGNGCCDICGKHFSFLERHRLTHTGERATYSCTVCDKSFAWKGNLSIHYQRCHNKKKNDTCSLDSASFSSQPLTQNTRVDAGNESHVCALCNKGFSRHSNLSRHMKIHAKKEHTCLQCGKSYVSKYDLTQHGLIHTGDASFRCKTCNKGFLLKKGCNRHELTHLPDGERPRPYDCEICHKTFTHKWLLRRHMGIHSNMRAYKCGVCEKSFMQSTRLIAHMKVHTGKEHLCEVCGLGLRSKRGLKYHLAHVHVAINEPLKSGNPVESQSTSTGSIQK